MYSGSNRTPIPALFCERYRGYTKATTPVMRQIYKGGEKTFVECAHSMNDVGYASANLLRDLVKASVPVKVSRINTSMKALKRLLDPSYLHVNIHGKERGETLC